MTRSSDAPHSTPACEAVCLGAAFAYPAAVLAAIWACFGLTHGALFEEASVYVILYIPFLTLCAAVRPHFRPIHAAVPIALIGIDTGLSIAGLPSFLMILELLAAPVAQPVAPGVLGKSLLLVAAPLITGLVMLFGRTSMFRLVAVVTSMAQVTTMILFHFAVLTWPLEGMEDAERDRVENVVMRDGDLGALCSLPHYVCHKGDAASAQAWARNTLPWPHQAEKLIVDTADRSRLLYTWVERPAPDNEDPIAAITAFKAGPDTITLMASTGPPSTLYASLQFAVGVLITAFQQAWIVLSLLILWRHGDREWRGGRWQPPAPPKSGLKKSPKMPHNHS